MVLRMGTCGRTAEQYKTSWMGQKLLRAGIHCAGAVSRSWTSLCGWLDVPKVPTYLPLLPSTEDSQLHSVSVLHQSGMSLSFGNCRRLVCTSQQLPFLVRCDDMRRLVQYVRSAKGCCPGDLDDQNANRNSPSNLQTAPSIREERIKRHLCSHMNASATP
jgi:hypothetical protein